MMNTMTTPDFGLRLGEDDESARRCLAWLEYEKDRIEKGEEVEFKHPDQMRFDDSRAEEERMAAAEIAEKIRPLREEAFRKMKERCPQ